MTALHTAPVLHLSLAVTALDPAVGFFRDVLGYAEVFRAEGLAEQIARMTGVAGLTCDLVQMRRAGEAGMLELIAFRPAPHTAVPAAHLAFAVADLAAAVAVAQAAGARLLGEVVAFSEGRSAYLAVPGGAVIELEEMADHAEQ